MRLIVSARAALGAVVAALALAAPAQATTATVRDGVLQVVGDPVADQVALKLDTLAAPAVMVTDGFEAVTAGPGCVPAGTAAACLLDGITAAVVRLGDGDDSLVTQLPMPVDAAGEAGNDSLIAQEPPPPYAPAGATLDGGDGNDRLSGTRVADVLRGGPGDDVFDGNAGDDVLDLGPGTDTVGDVSGDDRVEARDGTVDHVDCGPGTDTGYFDAVDDARNCELGVLPPAPVPDCAPRVQRPGAAALRRFRATGALVVVAAVDAPCALRARLLIGGRAVASTRQAARGGRVALRVSGRAALRRMRRARSVVLAVSGAGTGAPTRTRRLTLRLQG
jgi:hypothetical protein